MPKFSIENIALLQNKATRWRVSMHSICTIAYGVLMYFYNCEFAIKFKEYGTHFAYEYLAPQ